MLDSYKLMELKQKCFMEIEPRLLNLKRRGDHAYCLSPFREDKNPDSFYINLKNMSFYDFATSQHGDTIDIRCHMFGVPLKEYLRENLSSFSDYNKIPIQKIKSLPPPKEIKIEKHKVKHENVFTPPMTTNADFIHPIHGTPKLENIYEYIDINGNTIGYAVRFNLENGNKAVLPLTFDWSLNKWRYGAQGFNDTKPIFNEFYLANKNLSILIVEGEKSALFAQKLIKSRKIPVPKDTCVISWFGGCQCVEKVNWDLVKSASPKNIYFCPDFDPPGISAMKKLNKIFPAAIQVYVNQEIKGYDLADLYEEKTNVRLQSA